MYKQVQSFIAFLMIIVAGLCAIVQPSYAFDPPETTVEILSANQTMGKDAEVLMGLRISLPDGYKMTTALEGEDPSLRPTLIWSDSKNVLDVQPHWPVPKKIQEGGVCSGCYVNDVVIPLTVHAKDVRNPLVLKVKMLFSICKDMCIPQEKIVSMTLMPGDGARSGEAFVLEKALKTAGAEDSLALMLLFAFVGGLILNFMPCVLPVLSLKLSSLARQQELGAPLITPRARLLTTAFGIMTSFWVLGGIGIALDQMGQEFGWGLHFQQPSFLVFMIVLLTVFSCNLWGFYDIDLPLSLKNRMSSIFGHHFPHLIEDYVTGVLATLLATPCTAPFLGTALGFAFARSGFEILVIFSMMGLGFALPYWGSALLPAGWIRLPKPGAWMERLSVFLGWVLALTVGWLLFVLRAVLGVEETVLVTLGVLGVITVLWLARAHPGRRLFVWPFILLIVISPLLEGRLISLHHTIENARESIDWQPLKDETIGELVKKGHIVFVDITADWCMTCKVNKALVLNKETIAEAFKKYDVKAVRGDWTKRDPLIAQFLKKFGRRGIPFNIVFGPEAPDGIVLSEVLQTDAVIKALEVASGKVMP